MKGNLAITMGAAMLILAASAGAQTTCLRNFDQIICSDGRNGLVTPDGTIWSDGSSVYQPFPDQIFINPPTSPSPGGSVAPSSPPLLPRPRR
jgi:hypothetical protein